MKTVTDIGAIRLFPTFFSFLLKTTTLRCECSHWSQPYHMMVLFVICVRLSEILHQKTPQPRRPGISGVRQLSQLIFLQAHFCRPPLMPPPPGVHAALVAEAEEPRSNYLAVPSTPNSCHGTLHVDFPTPCCMPSLGSFQTARLTNICNVIRSHFSGVGRVLGGCIVSPVLLWVDSRSLLHCYVPSTAGRWEGRRDAGHSGPNASTEGRERHRRPL